MNRTNWEHGLYMLVLQAVCVSVCFAFGVPVLLGAVLGFAFVMGVFFHREYTQAEDIAVKKTSMTRTQLQLWHVARYMTLDGYLDWLVPVIIGVCVMLFVWGGL